ncbi:S26 family signal peptidase [Singulisphaera sp. PoT]|uniref:S26 family signal peptidase n=1 Tax=Singulisphaera sp. PoT TaxID=3411797 RepID=UPI003BF5B561
MSSNGRIIWREAVVANSASAPRWKAPAGLKILVPGYAQWRWNQRERATVLFGSFVMAVGVGIFTWGTITALAVFAFAFGTHVVSTVDVMRQTAFPGFGRWMPWLSASGGLAVGVYGPAVCVASLVAWPASSHQADRETSSRYLVNYLAYRKDVPTRNEWIWIRPSRYRDGRVGQIVAIPGQEVEWTGNQLRVDGKRLWLATPCHSLHPPEEMAYVVPAKHFLVNTDTSRTARRSRSGGLELVPADEIAGRAWARLYPIQDRELLQ